ncbi:MAG: aspartate aminotransferase family protein [Candidatus Dormibacteraeota bacterium]|nr:aspartate aminotransferase family protein [Candidatus Dormibacteraeota bacterium]
MTASTDLSQRYARSIALHRRAGHTMPGGVNSNFRLGGTPVPLFWSSGEGAHLTDADGNDYVDYVLGMGPAILGHRPPSVVEAVAAALSLGQTLAGQHQMEIELAELIVRAMPAAEEVRIASSGSEAVQLALRIARAATGRRLVLKFEGHYHGWLDTIMVSTSPSVADAGPDDAPVPVLQSAGQSAAAASDVRVLPWNDAAAIERFMADQGHEVAAVIMEPILCNTSVVVPRPGYLERVRDLVRRAGSVLIFDEVITGFRVGPGGAQALLGVTPDLTVLGKALGAGFPVAALAGRRDLMELTATGGVVHGGTYNANLVAASAAREALRLLTDPALDLHRRMNEVGARLVEGLRELGTTVDPALRVQGLGTVFNTAFTNGVEVVDYRSYQRADQGRQRRFLRALQDRGVRVTSRGTWFLSSAHTAADVDRTLAAAADALREVMAAPSYAG